MGRFHSITKAILLGLLPASMAFGNLLYLTPFKGLPVEPPGFVSTRSICTNGGAGLSGGNVLDKVATDSFTMSAWIKPTTMTDGRVMQKGSWAPSYNGYTMQYDPVGSLNFVLRADLSNTFWISTAAGKVLINTWTHVAVSHAGSPGGVGTKLFINGVDTAYSVNANTLAASISNSESFGLFTNIASGNLPMIGCVDDPSMWGIALTAPQVAEIYGTGKPGDLDALSFAASRQGWWLNGDDPTDSISTTIKDQVGGNHLTATSTSGISISTDVP